MVLDIPESTRNTTSYPFNKTPICDAADHRKS